MSIFSNLFCFTFFCLGAVVCAAMAMTTILEKTRTCKARTRISWSCSVSCIECSVVPSLAEGGSEGGCSTERPL